VAVEPNHTIVHARDKAKSARFYTELLVREVQMPTLHFIYGLPGVGKTGLARRLAAFLPAEMFCEDEYLAALQRPITTLEHLIEALEQVREEIAPLALGALQNGRSVVFDFAGNTVTPTSRTRSASAECASAMPRSQWDSTSETSATS
jgi:hypothetical protein